MMAGMSGAKTSAMAPIRRCSRLPCLAAMALASSLETPVMPEMATNSS